MTNKFKEGRESKNKKLLVPVLALFLCATALIGVGYAAVVSSVGITGNVVDDSHVYIDFQDKQATGSFSSGIGNIDVGRTKIDGVSYYTLGQEKYVVGNSVLVITANNYTGNVKLTYTVTTNIDTDENATAPNFKLYYNKGTMEVLIDSATGVTGAIDDFNAKSLILKAVYKDEEPDVDGINVGSEPKPFTYAITVTCEQVV